MEDAAELTIQTRIKGSRRSVRANLQLIGFESRTVSVSLAVTDPDCGGGHVPMMLVKEHELEAWLQVREALRILADKSDAQLRYDASL